jgi:hypothetical protein
MVVLVSLRIYLKNNVIHLLKKRFKKYVDLLKVIFHHVLSTSILRSLGYSGSDMDGLCRGKLTSFFSDQHGY